MYVFKVLKNFAGPIICLIGAMISFWISLDRHGYLTEFAVRVSMILWLVFLYLTICWLFFKLIDMLVEHIIQRTSLTGRSLDTSLAVFIAGTLKILSFLIAAVLFASNMGYNVTGLVAGLGIGGLAIALAAKESLENLFGSMVIFTDRPFRAGDWVVIGDSEGFVENVGFRSTRIRTFYNSLITIPNGDLMRSRIDNLGVRKFRRTKTTLSVTYGTPPAKIEAFCAGIRQLIKAHPCTRNDTYQVWFHDFGSASLDIELVVHIEADSIATENRERHRLFLDIMRLAQVLEVEFAFPTQTIYMGKETAKKPVFPEVDNIYSCTKGEIEYAESQAREIALSAIGGGGIPGPFRFESP